MRAEVGAHAGRHDPPMKVAAAQRRISQRHVITDFENKLSTEIPTGSSSERDATMQSAAERELLEETGLRANRWRDLGSIDNSNGATTEVAHLFLATDLVRGQSHQDSEESIELRWCSYGDVVKMVLPGEITESCSVASILKTEILRSSGQVAF
jgi:8-oxo-dGTP pyrophosphatase MutT (NUDIX family)